MIHALKIEQKHFEAVIKGEKTFEIRKNDRGYQVGDILALNEFDNNSNKYTDRSALVSVDYILDDEKYLAEEHIVMGIKPCALCRYDSDPMRHHHGHYGVQLVPERREYNEKHNS